MSITISGQPQMTNEMVAEMDSGVIKLLVVSQQEIYADGLIHLLKNNPQHDVVCLNPQDNVLEQIGSINPNILMVHQVVIENSLQNMSLDELFGGFKTSFPGLRIVVFGTDINEAFIRQMIRAGVHGFIDGSMTNMMLQHAIREVYLGGYWIERQILDDLIHNAIEMEKVMEKEVKNRIEHLQCKLTRREADVFHLVMEGMQTKEIANTMHLSEQGVKLHLGRLFKKFQVSNRTQLILMAFTKVCPVANLVGLIRRSVDKRRIEKGYTPLIADPLESNL